MFERINFNMIKDIIKNDNYEINIKDNLLHIKNYINIIDISTNRISILIKSNKLIINGSSLMISKLDEYELLIKGNIKDISFINE